RCRRQRLLGEKKHQMLEEQLIEAIEQRLAALPAQIDTFNQRANGWGQTIDAQGRLGHACLPSATGFSMRPHAQRMAVGSSIARPPTNPSPGRAQAIARGDVSPAWGTAARAANACGQAGALL